MDFTIDVARGTRRAAHHGIRWTPCVLEVRRTSIVSSLATALTLHTSEEPWQRPF